MGLSTPMLLDNLPVEKCARSNPFVNGERIMLGVSVQQRTIVRIQFFVPAVVAFVTCDAKIVERVRSMMRFSSRFNMAFDPVSRRVLLRTKNNNSATLITRTFVFTIVSPVKLALKLCVLSPNYSS